MARIGRVSIQPDRLGGIMEIKGSKSQKGKVAFKKSNCNNAARVIVLEQTAALRPTLITPESSSPKSTAFACPDPE